MAWHSMDDDMAFVMLDEEMIQKRVKELGKQISDDYRDCEEEVILLCLLRGASVFFADLARAMDIRIRFEFMGTSSYGDERKSSGIVRITKDLDTSIDGKHVIIAEDIMDSGHTLSHLKRLLESRNPKSLRICTLLDKPDRRETDITPDYCGFVIPDEFVVGYGLDYTNIYRNLPYVGVLKPEVYRD